MVAHSFLKDYSYYKTELHSKTYKAKEGKWLIMSVKIKQIALGGNGFLWHNYIFNIWNVETFSNRSTSCSANLQKRDILCSVSRVSFYACLHQKGWDDNGGPIGVWIWQIMYPWVSWVSRDDNGPVSCQATGPRSAPTRVLKTLGPVFRP